MNGCTRLSERMPEVALLASDWTPEETSHLESCTECRAEWALLLAVRRMEERAPTVSDPAALAASLRERLARDRARRGSARRAWSWVGAAAAAAAIVVAVMSRRAPEPSTPRSVAEAETLVPLPELEGLAPAQLDTLLQSIDRPFAGTSTLDASTLGEHEEGELEQAFASWEG